MIVAVHTVQSWSSNKSGVIVTTNKATYSAQKLVITAGSWSSKILRDLQLPLQILRKSLFWFSASDSYSIQQGMPCFLFLLSSGSFYGFPKLDLMGLKVAEHSGGQKINTPDDLNCEPYTEDEEKIIDFLWKCIPGISRKPIEYKLCMYTMSPDENFIIDHHPLHSNVSFAAGFSGHGFKFASLIGEVLADLALDGKTKHPIQFLKLRF